MSDGSVNRDIVWRWQEAVLAVDSGRLGDAHKLLWEIRHFSAKIWYNLAVVHLMENDYTTADQRFDECLQKDEYLAVALFQRGVIACLQGRLCDAQEMFARAQKNVRNGEMIDYRQLGLAVRLTLKQIEHNHNVVEKYFRQHSSVTMISPQELEMLPPAMFRPAKSLVDNLQKQQFLQKAKVVSSVPDVVQDCASKVAGSTQSLSAPASPSSQRRLRVSTASQPGPRTPPPQRPPPRLPPSLSSTRQGVRHCSSADRKGVSHASARCDPLPDSVTKSAQPALSGCQVNQVLSATRQAKSLAGPRRGDNTACEGRQDADHTRIKSCHGSQAREVRGGTVSPHTAPHPPVCSPGLPGSGLVEVTPAVGSVAAMIAVLNSSQPAGAWRDTGQPERNLGTSASQQAILEGSGAQVARMPPLKGSNATKPARPPPPKTSSSTWS